ncbi:MAG TPA: sugar transferase [Tepidisphaeraceae bacterium]|nr:sugar transferase [Tepidisphaeraceae bacterium]
MTPTDAPSLALIAPVPRAGDVAPPAAPASAAAATAAVASSSAYAAAGVTPLPPAIADRTIWGLDVLALHARYWAAHGVQVVRQGEPSEIVRHAELFLLMDPGNLALFTLGPVQDTLNWVEPMVLFLRLQDARAPQYREDVVTDRNDRFVRFQRQYRAAGQHLSRVALTPDRDVALLWQSSSDSVSGWRRLRTFTPRIDRTTLTIKGTLYDQNDPKEVSQFLTGLVSTWRRPDGAIGRVRWSAIGKCWADPESTVSPKAKAIGPVWVGTGRHLEAGATVIGPAIVWDAADRRPATGEIQWQEIEPRRPPEQARPADPGAFDDAFKRTFDVCFATLALLMTLPLYPLICLAIWWEDGRPFFFAHWRETKGGKEFPCLKFRSMRKDAEKIKEQLKKLNQADGPQFFMENDPRLTRVGRFLRKVNLDELPQFLNVLAGHMSIVGPRASPYKENQFSPAWREARLSVRAGITGLWQVKRTRRAGSDFQEWIKYDIEYVEKRNWRLDLLIIWQTIRNILGKVSKS